MKKLVFLLMILLTSFALSACAGKQSNTTVNEPVIEQKAVAANYIKITIDNQQVIVRLYDNLASRDLLTMLPLTLTFEDYQAKEKISYLPRKLATQGAEKDNSKVDDFTYFAPWGNLAIFYNGKQQGGNGLIILGTIESGKAVFSNLNANFTATIEKIE